MVNLFAESVEIVFRDIHGNPIFDIYNDEDQIQDEDKLDDRESNNQSDEVHYQQIGFLLTDDEMEGGCDGEVVGDGSEKEGPDLPLSPLENTTHGSLDAEVSFFSGK
uniref:Uncharacterized protein n=1 Tax=Brassica campestris TaxID=3711 RepID=M4DWW7_BRACM